MISVQPFDRKKQTDLNTHLVNSLSLWVDLWNNELQATVLRPSWLWQTEAGLVHLWCFRLPLGSRIRAWGCHIARCAERHFPTQLLATSSRHEGGHLHPHRPRRSNVLVFHVRFSWVRDPSRLIQQQQGCCERTRINIRQQVTYFVWGFASTLICH